MLRSPPAAYPGMLAWLWQVAEAWTVPATLLILLSDELCPVVSYCVPLYPIVSYCILLYAVVSHCILLYAIASSCIVLYLIVSCCISLYLTNVLAACRGEARVLLGCRPAWSKVRAQYKVKARTQPRCWRMTTCSRKWCGLWQVAESLAANNRAG